MARGEINRIARRQMISGTFFARRALPRCPEADCPAWNFLLPFSVLIFSSRRTRPGPPGSGGEDAGLICPIKKGPNAGGPYKFVGPGRFGLTKVLGKAVWPLTTMRVTAEVHQGLTLQRHKRLGGQTPVREGKEEVNMAFIIYAVVALVGILFLGCTLLGLRSSE